MRAATALLWAGAAASAVYWGLRIGGSGNVAPVQSAAARLPAPDTAAIARLLGQGTGPVAAVIAPPAANRYQLLGVVSGRQGAALIAVEGRPAKPYRIGAVVDDGVVLQSVAPRRAVLANATSGTAIATLEMAVPGGGGGGVGSGSVGGGSVGGGAALR